MVFISFFILAAIGTLSAMFCIDKVIRIQYEKYRSIWVEDGSPRGFFFTPPETENYKSLIYQQLYCYYWLIRSPKWTTNEPEARKYLLIYRVLLIAYSIIGFVLFPYVLQDLLPSQ